MYYKLSVTDVQRVTFLIWLQHSQQLFELKAGNTGKT